MISNFSFDITKNIRLYGYNAYFHNEDQQPQTIAFRFIKLKRNPKRRIWSSNIYIEFELLGNIIGLHIEWGFLKI